MSGPEKKQGVFFFFCVPSYISGVQHSSSSSVFPVISLGFNILLLLLLCSQLYLWGSPFFFFFCVPSYISGVHHSSSSSVFPAISLGFTILPLLLCSQLYLWGSPFFFFFCVPSYISGVQHSFSSSVFPSYMSGVHPSSSSVLPALSLGFTILGEICAYVTVFLIQPIQRHMIIWTGQDYPTGNSSRREMKRQTEETMGRQPQRVDWL